MNKKWRDRFAWKHGDRLVFAAILISLAGLLYYAGQKDQALSIVMLIVGAFATQLRSPKKDESQEV